MSLLLYTPDSTSGQLAAVAHELARLSDRIDDVAIVARGLADATDWQAKAATAFHDRATAWAGEVSSLVCAAETARQDATLARDRAAFAEALPGLSGLRLPGPGLPGPGVSDSGVSGLHPFGFAGLTDGGWR